MRAKVICDNCGAAEAEADGWFCDKCVNALLSSYDAPASETAEDPCNECAAAPASLFGVCDDCYDAAYNTRHRGTSLSGGYTPGWREQERTPPVSVPAFADEVQTLHRTTKAALASV